MNYEEIEKLALLSKEGDPRAKEQLMKEFTPIILSLVSKSYIQGYEAQDLKNECYASLFKCVEVYNPQKHKFVAYAVNSIKNSIGILIRNAIRRQLKEDSRFSLSSDNLDHLPIYDKDFPEDTLCKLEFDSEVKAAVGNLSKEEKTLLHYVFFKDHTLLDYAKLRGINYRKAVYMKTRLLGKLKNALKNENYYRYYERT